MNDVPFDPRTDPDQVEDDPNRDEEFKQTTPDEIEPSPDEEKRP